MGTDSTSPARGLEDKANPEVPLRVLIAFNPHSTEYGGDEALRFAAWLAQTTPVRVRVVTTLLQPWGTGSLNKLGGKYKKWLAKESAALQDAVKESLSAAGVPEAALVKRFSVVVAGSNRAQIITDVAADFKADLIVLGPHHAAPKSRIMAGSTADALLHYSPVPLGLTPRGVKLSKHGITRVNFAYTEEGCGTHEIEDSALRSAAALAARWGVPLRILAFSPTGLVHAPMHDKLDVAKQLTMEWREHSLGLLDLARDLVLDDFPELDVSTEVGSGVGWQGAVDSLKWKKGDLMVLGSAPQGAFARVFLGSTATELLPHLRVPVLVNPSLH